MSQRYLRKYSAGQFVFREGDPADCAFIIEKGRLQVIIRKDGEDIPIANFGPGDIIGEMAIIDGLPRSASVMAMEDCELSTVSRKLLNERIDAADPIVRLLISLLLKRIRNSNQNLLGGEGTKDAVASTEAAASLSDKDFQPADARERLKLENELLEALQRREFFLEYQDIVDLRSRDLVGFEALLRWQSPDRGLVRPDQFINVAEQTSVIIPLGYWIIEQSFIDMNAIHQRVGNRDLFMSINVSVRQLNDPQFTKRIERLQKKYKIDASTVKLEVTERVFQEDPLILQTVSRLREMGYQISLDDFGTGYSSLTSLFNMQVDNIKVDRSFVSTLLKDPKSRAIVQAVVAMGIELGLGVVAEGIEVDDEALFLAGMGCQMGQGYYFSRPQSLVRVLSKLTAKKSSVA